MFGCAGKDTQLEHLPAHDDHRWKGSRIKIFVEGVAPLHLEAGNRKLWGGRGLKTPGLNFGIGEISP